MARDKKQGLGMRGQVRDEDARQVWANIAAVVDRDSLEQVAEATILEIRERMRGKRVCVAWSGGKDSLVVEHVMARAGYLGHRILGISQELEYPAMEAWYQRHLPTGTTIKRARKLTLSWLARYPHLVFPRTNADKHKFWTWQQAQQEYAVETGREVIVLGRRIQDQNFCGQDGLYLSRGVWRYSPIRHWTHEQVMAYIHYHNLPVPPCYAWYNGFAEGTHPWPDRSHTVDQEDGWAQVYSIDPSVVQQAASVLPGAAAYLANPTPIKTPILGAHGKTRKQP